MPNVAVLVCFSYCHCHYLVPVVERLTAVAVVDFGKTIHFFLFPIYENVVQIPEMLFVDEALIYVC
jgi:hypothetical protein